MTDSALRNWIERSQNAGAGAGLSPAERQELLQLSKENHVLRMERALLKNQVL